jgi:cation:H+ antiporter
MLAAMSLDNEISRLDAILLFIAFLLFMAYTLRLAKKGEKDEDTVIKPMKPLKAVFLVLLGLVCLIVGSNLFVESASVVAKSLGVSDAMIGLTIVAGGTSLPELATSVVAALKGRSSIAIGNVIGSNVFNILMILGITGMICPMDLHGITLVDMGVLVGGILLLWAFSYTKYTVARWEGALLTLLFCGYMGWLIYQVV